MVLMIDNYDSFTYNLVQYFGELGVEAAVHRNDEITLKDVERVAPSAIVVSPGPGTPKDAGISVDVVRHFAGKIPILGVCLGHQTIGYALGTEVVHARTLMHGKTSPVFHDGKSIFKNVQSPFTATRYHSLALNRATLAADLEISAWTDDGEIMGIRHKRYVIEGVQFHPESILTKEGKGILKNFLNISEQFRR